MSQVTEAAQEVTDEELLALWDEVCNWGRWGDDDELGTLNYITPEVRRNAAALVRTGHSFSISRIMEPYPENVPAHTPEHHMVLWPGEEDFAVFDYMGIQPHGFAITHLDAISHCAWEDKVYNGRSLKEITTHQGVTFASTFAQKEGIFTRGVFLDIPAARGVDYLEPDDSITAEDLEAAERMANVTVRSGDALLVRSGLDAHEAAVGHALDVPPRAGLVASAIRWLHQREVAVFGGDCVEKIPYSSDRFVLPLHQIGLPAMGLVLLDLADVSRLAVECKNMGRYEFLLTVAPLALPRTTGCAVNPIVTF